MTRRSSHRFADVFRRHRTAFGRIVAGAALLLFAAAPASAAQGDLDRDRINEITRRNSGKTDDTGQRPKSPAKTNTNSNASDNSASSGSASRKSGVFPPSPTANGGPRFYRGNLPAGSGGSSMTGYYLNWRCWIPLLAMFLLWIHSSHWVNDDSSTLKVQGDYWNSVVFLTGLAGFLAVFIIPLFPLGFGVLLFAYGFPLGLYIQERNGRVPDSARVMTPEHIRKFTVRTLAKLGINLGPSDSGPATSGPPIQFIGKSVTGRDDDTRTRQVENSKGFLAAKELVYDAIMRRATDIHLEPKDEELAVRLRIDGVMYPTEPFDRRIGDSVCNIFKVLCAMDITQKRKAQDGSFRAKLDDRDIDFRTATQGTRHGEKLSLRILDQSNSVSSLGELGFRKQLLEKLEECVALPHGLLLSCGPTGAGKSTTLYAAIKGIDSYQRNIITVEDPIEYKIDNVNQIEINPKAGQTFGASLRSILRQDPDVLMIGEIRDKETADIACQAANTGHMVFSTIHANDTITALFRLLELGVEPFMAANSVTAILGQRLLRRLCRDCRETYRPSNKLLEEAGLPPDKVDKLYRPPTNPQSVCSSCSGLGYRGRTGVFEFLEITDHLRELIREKANMTEIRTEARNHGMLYMQEEGLRLVALGTTSMEELMRVVK